MQIRKVLGKVVVNDAGHGIAKTENGKYVVGDVLEGQPADTFTQFQTINEAFEHWYATVPITDRNHLTDSGNRCNQAA